MNDVLDFVKNLGPIVVGLAGLIIGYIYNQRSLKQKQFEDERKEIYKKLNSFYGPLRQLRGISLHLYEMLRMSRGANFRTLLALLNGEKFEGNDKVLLEQILAISKKIDELIIANSGLIAEKDMQSILAKAGAHIRIIQLAYDGDLTGQVERFKDYVFPRELDQKIDEQIAKLNRRLDELNNMKLFRK